jgi:hypothetical protein
MSHLKETELLLDAVRAYMLAILISVFDIVCEVKRPRVLEQAVTRDGEPFVKDGPRGYEHL